MATTTMPPPKQKSMRVACRPPSEADLHASVVFEYHLRGSGYFDPLIINGEFLLREGAVIISYTMHGMEHVTHMTWIFSILN